MFFFLMSEAGQEQRRAAELIMEFHSHVEMPNSEAMDSNTEPELAEDT